MAQQQQPIVIHDDPCPLRLDEDGVIRVGRGRLSLNTVVEAYREHMALGEIAAAFQADLADIHAAIAYYHRHHDEVKPYLEQQAYNAYRLREQIEAEQPPFPTRAELLERWSRIHAQTAK